MKYQIENTQAKVIIESKGAELDSFFDKAEKYEYVWQKDAKFWGKSSPVLFPFVGTLKDGKFIYEGKEYKIDTRHGFARDNEFIVSDRGENFIEFLFKSNEETRKKYPFDFELYLKYILTGKELKLEYKVKNLTDGEMYFSIGAHPAFNVFSKEGENYLEFEKDENGEALTIENAFVIDRKRDIFQGKILNFDDNTFKNDAIVLKKTNSNKVFLKSKKDKKILEFDYEGFEYIAFWSVPGSNFVCFEPWDGISDYYKTDGDITKKLGIKKLEKGEIYQKGIVIKIF